MPATTSSDNRVLADHRDKIEGAVRNLTDGTGIVSGFAMPVTFGESITISTSHIDDVNDIRRIYLFPAGAYLTDFRGTPSDMDTNATPTLVYSILTTDSSDVTQLTVVSGSTNGQAAAGSDLIATAAKGRYVGGQYLVWKTTTASATPAAGTYKFYLAYSIGINSYAYGLEPAMVDIGN